MNSNGMKKILVLDPSVEFGHVLKRYLEEKGMAVRHETTSQDAVHSADSEVPDLVILEIILPEHNGVEFLHEFRSYKDWMDIPAIIYSRVHPEHSDLDRRSLKSLGVVHHLYKPTTTLAELHVLINEIE